MNAECRMPTAGLKQLLHLNNTTKAYALETEGFPSLLHNVKPEGAEGWMIKVRYKVDMTVLNSWSTLGFVDDRQPCPLCEAGVTRALDWRMRYSGSKPAGVPPFPFYVPISGCGMVTLLFCVAIVTANRGAKTPVTSWVPHRSICSAIITWQAGAFAARPLCTSFSLALEGIAYLKRHRI